MRVFYLKKHIIIFYTQVLNLYVTPTQDTTADPLATTDRNILRNLVFVMFWIYFMDLVAVRILIYIQNGFTKRNLRDFFSNFYSSNKWGRKYRFFKFIFLYSDCVITILWYLYNSFISLFTQIQNFCLIYLPIAQLIIFKSMNYSYLSKSQTTTVKFHFILFDV